MEILLQVVALCQAPFLLDDPNVGLVFPADAIAKAKHYIAMTSGGLGISTWPSLPSPIQQNMQFVYNSLTATDGSVQI